METRKGDQNNLPVIGATSSSYTNTNSQQLSQLSFLNSSNNINPSADITTSVGWLLYKRILETKFYHYGHPLSEKEIKFLAKRGSIPLLRHDSKQENNEGFFYTICIRTDGNVTYRAGSLKSDPHYSETSGPISIENIPDDKVKNFHNEVIIPFLTSQLHISNKP